MVNQSLTAHADVPRLRMAARVHAPEPSGLGRLGMKTLTTAIGASDGIMKLKTAASRCLDHRSLPAHVLSKDLEIDGWGTFWVRGAWRGRPVRRAQRVRHLRLDFDA
jgi:hypothetical protein